MLEETDKGTVLGAALELANTQLLVQSGIEAGLDAQAMGLLAMDGALLGVGVAGRELVGSLWFVPVVALLLGAVLCLALRFGTEDDLGPRAARFYFRFGAAPAAHACEQLLADLDAAFASNARRVRAKERGLTAVRSILLGSVFTTWLLIVPSLVIRII